MNAPLDWLHAECLEMRGEIRAVVSTLRQNVAAWAPAPMPSDWFDAPVPRPVPTRVVRPLLLDPLLTAPVYTPLRERPESIPYLDEVERPRRWLR